jgi:signal transduction histidine kinase
MQKLLLFPVFLLLLFSANSQRMNVDSLMNLLSKAKQDTSKVTIYANLAATLRYTEPLEGVKYGKMGFALAKTLDFDKGIAVCYLNSSTAYIYADMLDSALLYLDTALVYAHKTGDNNRLGLSYLNRADIYRQLQNFNQSLKDCDTALSYAEKSNNDDVRARVNQTIGSIFNRQGIYPRAVVYYNKAMGLYQKTGNRRMMAVILNNLGLAYKSSGEFEKGIVVTKDAIRITDSLRDITNLSIYNANLSDIYYQMNNYTQSELYAQKAMDYAVVQDNDKLKSNAWSLLAETYLKQNRYTEAITVLNKALPIAKETDWTDQIYLITDMLAEAYYHTGDYAKAYENTLMAKEANDSLLKWKYDDELASMQTKFEVDEKDKAIQLLAKDKELQRQKLQRLNIIIIAAAAILLLVLGGLWLLMNRNKLKQRMKELELRNRIAADLHDEVGSSLSSIHMLSQMASQQGNGSGNNEILTRMSNNAKETMDKMGDIVWMIKPGETEAGSLKQRMERFAYEICSSKNIEVHTQLNDLEMVTLSMEQRKNIYLIFKEALNNAVKYSGTDKVDISISVQNKELVMQVKDFGKGFDSSLIKRGNGLDNMRHRSKEIGAFYEILSPEKSGTVILLKLKL